MIHKKKLSNGLTVLAVRHAESPKVSIQLWYGVGSKYEKSGQKGIAHLIEHMIFKGTETLSESDINLITHKLSGECNAFTSHDYTGYLFDFPSQHWHHSLPIMADCMRNCTFREEFLSSELKAVVQELRMGKDDHMRILVQHMMGSMFMDHPYRYPVIGYKHDLWSLNRDELVAFYQHHYVPNNAALVVVGDVEIEDVFACAQDAFGAIAGDPTYTRPELYHNQGLIGTSTTMLEHVQQEQVLLCWEVPGVREKRDGVTDLVSLILGSGRGSRLYRTVVDELELATDLESFSYDLFDHGLFFVSYQPSDGVESARVTDIITREIGSLVSQGCTDVELKRAIRKSSMDAVVLREQTQSYAERIGRSFTCTGDEYYGLDYNDLYGKPDLGEQVRDYAEKLLRPAVMHVGTVKPIPESEKIYWMHQQELSDAEDNRVLSSIVRDLPVQEGVQSLHVQVSEPKPFVFPRAERTVLSNGLVVLTHHAAHVPTIDILLELPFKHTYDPENKQGLAVFLSNVMQEGTADFTAQEFAQELEQYGMALSIAPGLITLKLLRNDIERGLHLLSQVLEHARLEVRSCDKVRTQLAAATKEFWDTPLKFVAQLTRELVYGNHPLHRCALGRAESVAAITHDDVVSAYRRWITPLGSRMALVGDIKGLDVVSLVQKHLGAWSGPAVIEPAYPAVVPFDHAPHMRRSFTRDQIVIAFGRISVSRLDPLFLPIMLFDQIFTGGVLLSMSSRLFELRERSGLFYSIGGSLVAGAAKQPGMVYIRTMVSPDRLDEAMRAIAGVIDEGASKCTEDELLEAKRAVVASLIDAFSTNRQAAASLLFLEEYGLPADYFTTRIDEVRSVNLARVKSSCGPLLDAKTFATVQIGRV